MGYLWNVDAIKLRDPAAIERGVRAWKYPSIGYFGSQGRYAAEIMPLKHPDADRWVDMTCGGFGTPYQFASQGVPVWCNDVGYYASTCAKYVLTDVVESAPTLDTVMIPFTTSPATNAQSFSAEVESYLRELTTQARKHEQWGVLAAVGRSIMCTTFRGMFWAKTDARGRLLGDLTPEMFAGDIAASVAYFNIFRRRIAPMARVNRVTWGDVLKSLDAAPRLSRCTVYFDPAWPWASGEAPPYVVPSIDVSGVLLGVVPEVTFWTTDILEVIGSWVEKCFEKDARRVILNTQSSNSPPPADVTAYLQAHFPRQYVKTKRWVVRPASPKKVEYWESWNVLDRPA